MRDTTDRLSILEHPRATDEDLMGVLVLGDAAGFADIVAFGWPLHRWARDVLARGRRRRPSSRGMPA